MTPVQQYRLWLGIGGVIIALFVTYYLFMAVDRVGLEDQRATAVVLGKEHRPPGRRYVTQIINNRPLELPQETPETCVLTLDLSGTHTEGIVARSLFDAVRVGDRVQVTYQRRRLTGGLQVVSVRN
jgi:hypothetical protein